MRRRIIASATSVFAALIVLISGSAVYAATPSNTSVKPGDGLRVSPVRSDVTIKPGASQTLDIYVENITASPLTLHGIINDFTASNDESGKPLILLDENSYAPSHGLKHFVAPISDFTLQPQQQKDVKVTVTIPANAAGGGYYGAIRFEPVGTDSGKNLSLTASVGSLILATVPGNISEQMGIASFNVAKSNGNAANFFVNGKGLESVIRFKNSGNIQSEPFGKIILKKSGKVLGEYEVNNTTPRGAILPDSIRRFTTSLGDKATGFGSYSIEGNFGYGSTGQLLSAKTTFFVVPLPYVIVTVLVLLVLLFVGFVYPRMMRAHDRRLIQKIRRGKSKK